MKYRQLLMGITAVMSFPLSIQAQTMDQMEPLERAKEEQIAREARLGEERIHVQEDAMHTIASSSTSLDGHTIPAEQPVQVGPSFLCLIFALWRSRYMRKPLYPVILLRPPQWRPQLSWIIVCRQVRA